MAINTDAVIFRSATAADIPKLFELYAPVRWNICLEDFDICLHHDEECILVAENEKGEIIGARLFLLINDEVALEEIYVVREDYRGKGIGMTLTQCGMKRTINFNRCCNSVDNMLEKYRKDYSIICDWKIRRFVGKIKNLQIDFVVDFKIVPYSANLFEELYQYDSEVLGLPRRKFLENFMTRTKGIMLIALKNNKICGFGGIREAEVAPFIGPMYADDPNIARVLLKNLVEKFPRTQELGIYINAFDKNPYVLKLMEDCELTEIDAYTRIYSKEIIPFDNQKLYVIHSASISY